MESEDGFELTPKQKSKERLVLKNFSRLLETEVPGFRLSYTVQEKSFLCQLLNKDKTGNSYEIEFPIPDSKSDKLETLIELFAQSEAGRIS